MTAPRIAILIDGGFFLKRLPKLVGAEVAASPERVVACMRWMCRAHVRNLVDLEGNRWHHHVHRIFFYDAVPYTGQAHHPISNRQIDFGRSDVAAFRRDLFDLLRRQRKVALRLGKVVRDGDWTIAGDKVKRLLATRRWLAGIDASRLDAPGTLTLSPGELAEMRRLHGLWTGLEEHQVRLALRQKGVDMRIGIDIASITLKKQANTIVLVAGDSDFVPAAKLARREGMEFILDPMWQSINDDLFEHIDGLYSGLARPKGPGERMSTAAEPGPPAGEMEEEA